MTKKYNILGLVSNALLGAFAGVGWIYVAIGFTGLFGSPTTQSITISTVVTILFFTILIVLNRTLIKKAKKACERFNTVIYGVISTLAFLGAAFISFMVLLS